MRTQTNDKTEDSILVLEAIVREIYVREGNRLPFHGWFHVTFVRTKAVEFAATRGADVKLVEAAALVHDLNYVVSKNSEPDAGRSLRLSCLTRAGFDQEDTARIEMLIDEAHLRTRKADISLEGTALADADMLFKSLPTTPILLAHQYLLENDVSIQRLAEKILDEQKPLLEAGTYFFDEALRERYMKWTRANIGLWQAVAESLRDDDVRWMLRELGFGEVTYRLR